MSNPKTEIMVKMCKGYVESFKKELIRKLKKERDSFTPMMLNDPAIKGITGGINIAIQLIKQKT